MSLPDATVNKNLEGRGVRASIQRFGGFLAGMIMPNIGAFIAWGLITALFIPAGWFPNATLAKLGDPMLSYLLPLLIAYTGGANVNGRRGGVVGAIATMGVVVGADIPMLLGAMVMGPLAAWILKQWDKLLEGHIKAGFEMLVDTFSIGILGMLLALGGHLGIEPLVTTLMGWLASGVAFLIRHSLLPLASIFVEPAKVLFLNNAINHGILTPLGIEQSKAAGKSILFMVESNPGPGFGLLMAYLLFGARKIRESVPGALIIHLFGGIHEIFFPYVLMKPKTILATILGAMSGLLVATWTGAGLVAPPAPGSIIAWFAMCPRNGYIPMILDFLAASAVSFVVAALLIRPDRKKDEAADLGGPSMAAGTTGTATATAAHGPSGVLDGSLITKVTVACDAGMGSSVMVASAMKKKLAPYGVEVGHTSVNEIPADTTLVLTQDGLVDRVQKMVPTAQVVPFTNYMSDPAFDRVEGAVRAAHEGAAPAAPAAPEGAEPAPAPVATATATAPAGASFGVGVLAAESIRLGLHARDKEDAIRQSGQVLVDLGAVAPEYIQGMLDREEQISTYMGEGVAIPHGVNEVRGHIKRAALGFLQFPDGVDWDGNTCYVAIPIASTSDEHLEIMASLARVLADKTTAEQLRTAATPEQVLALLAPEQD